MVKKKSGETKTFHCNVPVPKVISDNFCHFFEEKPSDEAIYDILFLKPFKGITKSQSNASNFDVWLNRFEKESRGENSVLHSVLNSDINKDDMDNPDSVSSSEESVFSQDVFGNEKSSNISLCTEKNISNDSSASNDSSVNESRISSQSQDSNSSINRTRIDVNSPKELNVVKHGKQPIKSDIVLGRYEGISKKNELRESKSPKIKSKPSPIKSILMNTDRNSSNNDTSTSNLTNVKGKIKNVTSPEKGNVNTSRSLSGFSKSPQSLIKDDLNESGSSDKSLRKTSSPGSFDKSLRKSSSPEKKMKSFSKSSETKSPFQVKKASLGFLSTDYSSLTDDRSRLSLNNKTKDTSKSVHEMSNSENESKQGILASVKLESSPVKNGFQRNNSSTTDSSDDESRVNTQLETDVSKFHPNAVSSFCEPGFNSPFKKIETSKESSSDTAETVVRNVQIRNVQDASRNLSIELTPDWVKWATKPSEGKLSLDLEGDDEYYFLQGPKNLNIKSLEGKKMKLNGECRIRGNSKTGEKMVCDSLSMPTSSTVYILLPDQSQGFTLRTLESQGSFLITEKAKVPVVDYSLILGKTEAGIEGASHGEEEEEVSLNKTPLPINLKVQRHPLYGTAYDSPKTPNSLLQTTKKKKKKGKEKAQSRTVADYFKPNIKEIDDLSSLSTLSTKKMKRKSPGDEEVIDNKVPVVESYSQVSDIDVLSPKKAKKKVKLENNDEMIKLEQELMGSTAAGLSELGNTDLLSPKKKKNKLKLEKDDMTVSEQAVMGSTATGLSEVGNTDLFSPKKKKNKLKLEKDDMTVSDEIKEGGNVFYYGDSSEISGIEKSSPKKKKKKLRLQNENDVSTTALRLKFLDELFPSSSDTLGSLSRMTSDNEAVKHKIKESQPTSDEQIEENEKHKKKKKKDKVKKEKNEDEEQFSTSLRLKHLDDLFPAQKVQSATSLEYTSDKDKENEPTDEEKVVKKTEKQSKKDKKVKKKSEGKTEEELSYERRMQLLEDWRPDLGLLPQSEKKKSNLSVSTNVWGENEKTKGKKLLSESTDEGGVEGRKEKKRKRKKSETSFSEVESKDEDFSNIKKKMKKITNEADSILKTLSGITKGEEQIGKKKKKKKKEEGMKNLDEITDDFVANIAQSFGVKAVSSTPLAGNITTESRKEKKKKKEEEKNENQSEQDINPKEEKKVKKSKEQKEVLGKEEEDMKNKLISDLMMDVVSGMNEKGKKGKKKKKKKEKEGKSQTTDLDDQISKLLLEATNLKTKKKK